MRNSKVKTNRYGYRVKYIWAKFIINKGSKENRRIE
jgi:hypothetical protein